MKFIADFESNHKCRIIIKSIITMCHDLGYRVVAEGVETKEEFEFLRESQCDFIQGFYFYKPMSQADFEDSLDASL
ncbi:EAL domain-containing protein [Eubacterium aggregans]|uniref:EAL domain-containing protein n=1 Tax=Eubacterium aggregans TaxID=81409 RepID=A0A1H3ZEN7_9FIRM|nr:EAL domain-containing protein [Eubacterium aggregans]